MKTAILLAAFGASNIQGRKSLANFEAACKSRFRLPTRWAYTSPLLRERLALQRQKSDSVSKALWRLRYEGYEAVAVQPLQTIPGREYGQVCEACQLISEQTGMACAVGNPLLGCDLENVARALLKHLPEGRDPGENVVFMGHGAKHPAWSLYCDLNKAMQGLDSGVFVGAMSGASGLDDILPQLNSRIVWLMPLFSTVGGHTLRDMAGSGPKSWKSRLEAAGHLCSPVYSGMLESPDLAAIWLENLAIAINQLGF